MVLVSKTVYYSESKEGQEIDVTLESSEWTLMTAGHRWVSSDNRLHTIEMITIK